MRATIQAEKVLMRNAIQQRRWWGIPLLLLLLVPLYSVHAAPAQQGDDYAIPGGRFFTQTANGQGGFSVVNDNQARFWAEYQRLGGAQTVGYPISQRFLYDGFVTQAFQKLVLQWRPEIGVAYPLNVFDELSEAGDDDVLYNNRQTPYPLTDFDPPNAPWGQIVQGRLSLLNDNPSFRARYFSVTDPLNVFGLPTSHVEDMGNHFAIRTQRAVFQQWKENVPWARTGQVTIANGGMIAEELGLLPEESLAPEAAPNLPAPTPFPTATPTPNAVWRDEQLLVGPGNTLWLVQVGGNEGGSRLLISGDRGATWNVFAGGLPECSNKPTLEYSQPNALYVGTCNGLFRWDGAAWQQVSPTTGLLELVIEYRNPQRMWALRDTSNNIKEIIRSQDGGQNWQRLATGFVGGRDLAIDASTHRVLYAAANATRGAQGLPILARLDATTPGNWVSLYRGTSATSVVPYALTLDGADGTLYTSVLCSSAEVLQFCLLRAPNADATDLNRITWEELHTFDDTLYPVRLAAGRDATNRFVLYAIMSDGATFPTFALYESLDTGATWSVVETPR